jgi:ribosomal protein L21E
MKVHLIEDSKIVHPITGLELKLGDKSIKQGSAYTITFLYEGDYSLWEGIGQIRNDYLGKGGTLVGEFNFLNLTYSEQSNRTTIVCNLKATVTKNIPATIYQGQQGVTLSNKTAYVYEIRLRNKQDNDAVISIVETSFLQVKPGVIQ